MPTEEHSPAEYHPPVEEYLETMLSLAEEGVPVIGARIASVWAVCSIGLGNDGTPDR